MEEKQGHRLGISEKICYGFGDGAANVYTALTGTFLTSYYTDTVGIAAAAVGTMMLVARLFDGVSDLAMGAVVDKTKSRWGKARPWVLWTAPFMMLGLILLFNVPARLGDSQKLIYAYTTYIIMNCIIYTANNLPYNALLSCMTLDVQDRASTTALRFVMVQLVTLAINAITANVLAILGWFWLTVIYGIVEVVMLLICFLGCKEHLGADSSGEVKAESVPLGTALPALLRNKYFYIQALLFVCLYLLYTATNSATLYFCNIVLGDIKVLTMTSMATSLPMIAANLTAPSIVKRVGKRKLMMMGCGLIAVGSAVVGLAGTSVPIVILGITLRGFGMGPVFSSLFAMTADVVDYGEWKTGIRSEGLVNSCTSFGMKVGLGLGSAVCTWILAFGGYVGTAETQTESAINAIRFTFGFLGAILAVVGLILVIIMNLDNYMKQIQADLEAKRR